MSLAALVKTTALSVAALAPGCSREALEVPCPPVAVGELVITEVRGAQDGGDDEQGEWIEVFNATDWTVSLLGLRVEVQKLDGTGAGGFLVRSPDLEVPAGGYAVLGRFERDVEPDHVDYGYKGDLDDELAASGAIHLLACDAEIDRVVYRGLTDFGSLALDGAIDPPSAAANDSEAAFCVDQALDETNPSAGARGTPGDHNPTCP